MSTTPPMPPQPPPASPPPSGGEQPLSQSDDPTESPDPDRADGQRRIGYPSGQGGDNVGVRMQVPGQFTCLGGAAQQQDAHQCRLPRSRPGE